MSEAYGLVLSFPDQSASFVYGFEAGQIWERMKAGQVAEIKQTINAANEEVLRRMAIAEGWEIEIEPCKDETGVDYPTYRLVSLYKSKTPERANPHGLRVVN